MKLKLKRLSALIMAVALLVLPLCACGEEAQTATEAAAEANAQGATEAVQAPSAYTADKDAAVNALLDRMAAEREAVYVYKDYALTQNHFTQKAKIFGRDGDLLEDMDENCTSDPYSGSSCIRCAQTTRYGDWGGWMFLNGYLGKGETVPRLNKGDADGQGLDLTGAEELRFWAKGEKGGEQVEFFTAGFGYVAETGRKSVDYPDSALKDSTGYIELTDEWEEYSISLVGRDMSYIVCGFGFVMNDRDGEKDNVFYLDEIRFVGDIDSALSAPVLLRSYDTDNIYISNAAYTYDNALTAMAFISDGRQSDAEAVLDAFVYAVENDRYKPDRIRNAYAAGDISAFPGWESGARLPGWYDNDDKEWYEDRYQVGSNVGNTAYAALAMLQYDAAYGTDKYLAAAETLMDWVLDECTDGGDGFTGGYDGWPESGDKSAVYRFTYKSMEHNIDAYAAFDGLYKATGEQKYKDARDSALRFIESMYDESTGAFCTGTTDDGKTPNKDNIMLDTQVWTAMALGDAFESYADSLKHVEEMKTPEGGYPFYKGNENGGWWAEGTAFTALMYSLRGDARKSEDALGALSSIQLDSGLFPAATVDDLSTSLQLFDGSPWLYSSDPHIAPTAWFVMAVNGFNPYSFD